MPSQICPKCQGDMRSYERNNVTIEQCAECRGIFLDRGELEQLLTAEKGYYQNDRDTVGYSDRYRHDDDDDDYRGDRNNRRGGFLQNLFDG